MDTTFDAVFYREPVPGSLRTLTLLGLLFDRVIFPGVYIPLEGVDIAETEKEIERIRELGVRSVEDLQLINCMTYAANAKYLRDFCVFTGGFGAPGHLQDGAKELAHELEELVFGPPPENFIPTITLGFAKGLPGDEKAGVNGPGWIIYPANALIYAAKSGAVLLNDDPSFPVPGVESVDLKAHAKALATVLALESVRLVLPMLKPLSFAQIAEFREATAESVKPFRRAMLRLSKDLNSLLMSDAPLVEVHRQARFLVETTVLPDLEELRQQLTRPSRPWYRWAIDLAKTAPQLVGNFVTLPPSLAAAKSLARVAEILADVRDVQLEREGAVKRGAFHYLLKVEQMGQGNPAV